jgi:hypothetical protein
MPDFNVRSDSVNVEQVMEQIRARIREKRGVDYTEEQIRELAAVKLEKFLDPRGVRSDLLEQFQKLRPQQHPVPLYDFDEDTLFQSHRGIVRFLRRLFRPLFKLVFNANALSQSLHNQVAINRSIFGAIERGDLYYELLHNLVLELTRTTIEVKNIKMRVESLASRLEFNERRARALESVVVYNPSEPASEDARAPRRQPEPRLAPEPPRSPSIAQPSSPAAPPRPSAPAAAQGEGGAPEGPGQRSRRRRRRRGRRGGASAVSMMTDAASAGASPHEAANAQTAAEPSPAVEATGARASEGAGPEDARDTRPEPIEQAFGSPAHASETRDAPAEPPAPGTRDTDDQ